MEMNKRDLERLREIEQMSSSSDEEVMLLRKQLVQARPTHRPPHHSLTTHSLLLTMYLATAYRALTTTSRYGVQARKDLDDAVAAKNLLELEIAGYERLLSGTGDGRAVRDKNAIGGVAKAMGGMSFAQTTKTTTITSSGGGFGSAGAGAGGYGAPPGGATYGHTAAGGAPAGPGVGAKAAGYPGAGAGPGGPTYGGPYGASPPTSPPAGLAGGYGGGYDAPPAAVPGGPGDLLFPMASVQPDGMVVGPDGRPLGRVSPTGVVVGPDGRIVGKMGPGGIVGTGPGDVLAANTSVRPDGMVVGPDGRPVGQARPDGMVVGPDGTVLGKRNADGSVVAPGPGDVLAASTLVQPDGMVMGPDGRPVGKMRGDGMVVGPDGKVVGQMTPNGAVVGASPGGGQPGWNESADSVHRFPWHKPGGGAPLQGSAPAPMNYGQQAAHAAPPPDSGLQGIYRDVTQGLKDIYFRGAPQAGPNQPQGAPPPGAGYGGPGGGAPPMLSAGGGGGMPAVGAPADLSGLSEFKLLTDEGPVVVRARSSGTAAYLKQMIQAQLFLSPRLTLTLTTGGNTSDGTDLRDDAVVERYASGGAEQLLLSAAPRPLSDFAVGAAGAVPLAQIRVRAAQRGQAYGPAMVIKPVGQGTTVAQLKATLLQAKNFPGMPADPNKLTLYFSPVFITADVLLGRKQRAALKDADSLSACQVVNDDIVYLEFLK